MALPQTQKIPIPRAKGRPRKGYNANPVLLIDSARLTEEMVQMRIDRASYREIAEKYGVATSTVFERIQRAIEASYEDVKESILVMRYIQNEDLEAMIDSVWEMFTSLKNDNSLPSIRAKCLLVSTAMKLFSRQAKLLNLDAKPQAEATPTNDMPLVVFQYGNMTEADIQKMLDERIEAMIAKGELCRC